MPVLDIDWNQEPDESGHLYPKDWDDIVEFVGPAHQLDYDMVWDDGNQGANLPRSLFCLSLLLSMNLFFLFLCCCVASFGEQGDEGDADGVQLPEPELDSVQAASTNEGGADGVQLPEPKADGVQASGMVQFA